jgi:hypothetical protein
MHRADGLHIQSVSEVETMAFCSNAPIRKKISAVEVIAAFVVGLYVSISVTD